MDFKTITAVVALVLVWVTLGTFIYNGWRKAKSSVTKWADTLLHNHAAHIQAAVEQQAAVLGRIESQQDRQIELLSRIADK
jgi:hypothetical protein